MPPLRQDTALYDNSLTTRSWAKHLKDQNQELTWRAQAELQALVLCAVCADGIRCGKKQPKSNQGKTKNKHDKVALV